MSEEVFYTCGHTRAELAGFEESRWGLPEVTYCINGYPVGLGLSPTDVEQIVAQAFASWNAVCGLRFRRVTNPDDANILMGVARGKRAGFDGPMGVLAYCYLPSGDNFRGQVEMYWDLDEPWGKTAGQNSIALLNVTAHELGHGLGLSHTNIARQLMNPTYSGAIASPQQAYDIAEVVRRYGPPTAAPTPTPPPLPPSGSPVLCKVQIGMQVYGGRLELLSGAAKVELQE